MNQLFGDIIRIKEAPQSRQNAGWAYTFTARPTTEDVDSYNEVTDSGAFMKAMKDFLKENPVAMFNHKPDWTIGKVLRTRKDATGPLVEIGVANTTQGRDVAELIRAGVVSKMSFMFGKAKYEEPEKEGGPSRLIDFKIYEVGPVSIPANMSAVIEEAKAKGIELKELSDEEDARMDKAPAIIEEHTKLLDEIDEKVGIIKDEIADLANDQKALEDARTEHAKTMKTVLEQVERLKSGSITEADYKRLSDSVSNDLKDLKDQIGRMKRAKNVKAERRNLFSWKQAKPTKWPQVFNDAGHALGEMHQRAYHLFHTPVDYDCEEGRQLKKARDLHDMILFQLVYRKKRANTAIDVKSWDEWKQLQTLIEPFDEDFAKAMSSTGTGTGDEWVPTEASRELYEAYAIAADMENYFPHWQMPSNPATWPVRTTRPTMYRASEATVDNPAELTKSNVGTSNITFTAETFGVAVMVSPQFIEDSIIAVVPTIRSQIALALAEGEESRFINGDASAAHMDTDATYAASTLYPERYEKGLRYMALNATATQAYDALNTSYGDGANTFGAGDVRGLREYLPSAYGHRASQLIYVTSIGVWLQMLSFAEYAQIGTYGANASWLTGDIPTFDGSPLILTGQLSEQQDDTGLVTDTANDVDKSILCINKEAFKVGEKRGITIEFDKNILTQQWAFVGSKRSSFKSMDTSGAEAVAMAYNIP